MASGERFGKYVLLNKIADGGMAEVFLAVVESLGGFQKRVALKKILPSFSRDESFVHSFVNEARICGQLHHPNVVQVYGFDRIGDYLCLAMEFIEGLDLERIITHRLLHRKLIPPSIAAEIVLQMLDGLEYAHTATSMDDEPLNIVHRDLKPSNILIDRSGIIKIVDFGVAKASTNLYKTMNVGTAKGTVSYMSPEQASGRMDLGPPSDVFGVGSILYELLTLRRLFDGDNLFMILDEVRSAPLEGHFAKIPREVPRGLVRVLRTALERDLSRRYPSAAAMAKDIRAVFPDLQGPTLLARFVEELCAEGMKIAGLSDPEDESGTATSGAAETRPDVTVNAEGGSDTTDRLGSFDLALLGVSDPSGPTAPARPRATVDLSSGREPGVRIPREDLATVPAETGPDHSPTSPPPSTRKRRPSPASVLRSSTVGTDSPDPLPEEEQTPVEARSNRASAPPEPPRDVDEEVTPVTRRRTGAPDGLSSQSRSPVPPVPAGAMGPTPSVAPVFSESAQDAAPTPAPVTSSPGHLVSSPEIDLRTSPASAPTDEVPPTGPDSEPFSEEASPGWEQDYQGFDDSPPQSPPEGTWEEMATEMLPTSSPDLTNAADWLSSQPMVPLQETEGGSQTETLREPLPGPLPNAQVESLLDQPPTWTEAEQQRPFGAPLERVVPEPDIRKEQSRRDRLRQLRTMRTILTLLAIVCLGGAVWTFLGLEPTIPELLFGPTRTRVTFRVIDPPTWGTPVFRGDPPVTAIEPGVFRVDLEQKAAYELKIVGPRAESRETYTVVIDPDDPSTWNIRRHFTMRSRR